MNKPTVIVSGLGRCGSSLVMQMLYSNGLKCAGDFPSFEPPESNTLTNRRIDPSWVRSFEAVKILDPHHCRIPLMNVCVIWMNRDVVQQAVSQVKFAVQVGGLPFEDGTAGRMVRGLRSEHWKAFDQWRGTRTMTASFDDLIDNSDDVIAAIAYFLKDWWSLDQAKMKAYILPRKAGSWCEPSLDIELALIHSAKYKAVTK